MALSLAQVSLGSRRHLYRWWLRLQLLGPRPIERKPIQKGHEDLYQQATQLLRAGYGETAVVTARIAIHQHLKAILKEYQWPERCHVPRKANAQYTLTAMVKFFAEQEIISYELRRALEQFHKKVGRVEDGVATRWLRSAKLTMQAIEFKSQLNEAMKLAKIPIPTEEPQRRNFLSNLPAAAWPQWLSKKGGAV